MGLVKQRSVKTMGQVQVRLEVTTTIRANQSMFIYNKCTYILYVAYLGVTCFVTVHLTTNLEVRVNQLVKNT